MVTGENYEKRRLGDNWSNLNKTLAASIVAPLWGWPRSTRFTQGVALGWLVTGLWPSAAVHFK
jgi:hypothetical protein